VLTGANSTTTLNSNTVFYATSFGFLASDPGACGAGTISPTQLVLAVSRVASATTNLQIAIYTADPVTGTPGSSVNQRTFFTVSLPATPSYLMLSLSALRFNAWDSAAFALVISGSPSFNLHAVNATPVNGTGAAFATLLSGNSGGVWAAREFDSWVAPLCDPAVVCS